MSRRREPRTDGSKRLRIVCTGRGSHPLRRYFTLDSKWVEPPPPPLEPLPANSPRELWRLDPDAAGGSWIFFKKFADDEWGGVKLYVECDLCGRDVPLTPETINRLGALVMEDERPTLDISLLT
jgi:hypothetical protein